MGGNISVDGVDKYLDKLDGLETLLNFFFFKSLTRAKIIKIQSRSGTILTNQNNF